MLTVELKHQILKTILSCKGFYPKQKKALQSQTWYIKHQHYTQHQPPMIFETERLYVRRWQQNDLQGLFELYGDPAIMQFIRPALTIEETKQIFDEQLLQYETTPQLGRFMIVEKTPETFAGIFMLRQARDLDGIEIGYSFRKHLWGKGYATEIVKKGLEFIFHSTKFNTVYAFTDLENISSKNVLTKCGFIYQYDLYEDGKKSNLFAVAKV